MNKLIFKSPAKLNLYLNVLRRRPDGYHDIETLFEKIALFDIITLRRHTKGIRLTTDNPALPTGRRNLAYRAAELLFKKAGFKGGVWVDIRKNIPIAAGLGGGSSNAAAVLWGMDRLFKLGFKQGDMIGLGKRLGADVPFFLHSAPFAVGRKRGDEVSPIFNDITIWHIIISFDFGISTKEAYEGIGDGFSANNTKILVLKNDIENLAASLYNSLEQVVLERFELIKTAKAALLEAGSYGAVMSGSGPTVFGLTKTREEAIAVGKRVQHRLAKCGSKVLVVETMRENYNKLF